jgi:hypothetical protein
MKIWITNLLCLIILALFICLSYSTKAGGQNASIGLHVSDGLSLKAEGTQELNFNNYPNVISAGTTVELGLSDPSVAILSLQGFPGREVWLTFDAPSEFSLNEVHRIPFEARFAYTENGSLSNPSVKIGALELPEGQNMLYIRLPAISDRAAGENSISALSKIYLFIYGKLGPIPHNAPPGIYSGNIQIHAGYNNN